MMEWYVTARGVAAMTYPQIQSVMILRWLYFSLPQKRGYSQPSNFSFFSNKPGRDGWKCLMDVLIGPLA